MKKTLLVFIFIISNVTFSQVTTSPILPTVNSEITVTFDASSTPLADYSGDIYAHTGVLTSDSTDENDWKYVIAEWNTNTEKAKLTKIATNTYELKISPEVFSFYNIDPSTAETITSLAFVFRSSTGSPQSENIYVELFEDGLNITITNPSNNSVLNLNDNITITAEASIEADLELFIDNTSIKTESSSKTISTAYTVNTSGYHTLKATANTNSENKETEISIFVKAPTQIKDKPAGLKYGVNKNPDNSVTFLLKAPLKNDIFIIGDFNNWELDENYQLFKDSNTEDFWLTIPNLDVNTEYAYQYSIDNGLTIADPYSEKILDPWNDQYIPESTYPNLKEYPTNLAEGVVSTFQINEENYTWETTNFIKSNQDNLIVYELLIRDFTVVGTNDIGDYNTAITKLDYLQSLGVNAIELMPINEFEGNDSWGYNPALYMALDKAYGTKNDFKKFVDACHERGIAVIADVVFNHSFDQSPLAQMYWNNAESKPASNNPWYNEDHNLVDNTAAHWGNDFNHESPYTVEFFNDVLSYWMTEYSIDGFRFDFTKGFSNTLYYGENNWASAYDADRIAILKNYADHVWNHNPTNKPYVIFEHLSEKSEEKELANYGIMLWGNSNHSYNQNTMGYSSGSDISWMSYQNRDWTNPNVMGYMESHDEERLMFKNLEFGNSNSDYNVKDLNTALSREEIAGMFFFTIPGPKLIWQFGELGYDFSIDENGRTGRKPIKWEYDDNPNRKHIYNTWATLIEFKKKYPEVFNSTDFTLNVGNTLTKSIVLKDTSLDVVVIGNFDIVKKNISTPFTKTGTWYEYFTGEERSVTSTSESIELQPGEYKMYSTVRLLDPRGGTSNDDSDNDGVVDTEDLCPNTMEGIAVNRTGCPIFELASDNFEIKTVGETCPNENNGQIEISADENLNYSTTIDGTPYQFTSDLVVKDLDPGVYEFCISVDGQTFNQCYEVTIEEGTSIAGKTTITAKKVSIDITKGTAPFDVKVNGETVLQTLSPYFSININQGDLIEVKTNVICEGVFSKIIDLNEFISAYPNPTNRLVNLTIPTNQKDVIVELYNMQSQLISSKKYSVNYGKIQLNLQDNPIGLYIAKVLLKEPVSLKIIKQ